MVRTILLLSLLPPSLSPFLRPKSRRQVVVNRTIISSSQMHFAPLLHSDKLNIPSKHFFQERRHLMFCFHGSANLMSGPLDSQTVFYLHRHILQHQNLHALQDHSGGFAGFSSLSANHVDLTVLQPVFKCSFHWLFCNFPTTPDSHWFPFISVHHRRAINF